MSNKISSCICVFLKTIFVLFIIAGSVLLLFAFPGIYKSESSQMSITPSNTPELGNKPKPENQEVRELGVDAPRFCTDMSYLNSFVQCLVPFKTVLDDLNGKTVYSLRECLQNLEEGSLASQNYPIFARIIREHHEKIKIFESSKEEDFEKLWIILMISFLFECDFKKLEKNISWTMLDESQYYSFVGKIELPPPDNFSHEFMDNIFNSYEELFSMKVPGPKLGIFSFPLNYDQRIIINKDIQELISKLSNFHNKYGRYELKSFVVHSRNRSESGDYVAYRKEFGGWYNISGDNSKLDNNFDLISNLPSMLFYLRVGD